MVVVCPGCKNQITVDDATIPTGPFKVRCTGCGRTISTQRKEEAASATSTAAAPPKPTTSPVEKNKTAPSPASSTAQNTSIEAYVNTQIAAAKKEILDAMQALFRGALPQSRPTDELSDSKRGLVCSGDPTVGEILEKILETMGYEPQVCLTAAESLKNLDEKYALILLDPSFTDDLEGAKKIIGRINMKKSVERRRMFVVLLSSTQKTLDGNSAFMNGVNLIVNKADLNNLESFVRRSQRDFGQMYSTFQSIVENK